MIHDVFDIEQAIARHPLGETWAAVRAWAAGNGYMSAAERASDPRGFARYVLLNGPTGDFIDCPQDAATVEQLRREIAKSSGADWGEAVPTDVFVWRPGAPRHPAATRIGGSPFGLGAFDWPINPENGEPFSFVGQLCLADSRDVLRACQIPEPPADVLLIFGEPIPDQQPSNDDKGTRRVRTDRFAFRWVALDAARHGSTGIPDPTRHPLLYPAVECHGVRWRTADFPGAETFVYDWAAEHWENPEEPDEPLGQAYLLPVLKATKLGGRPHMIQSEDMWPTIGDDDDAPYFAMIDSVSVATGKPSRYSPASPDARRVLMLADEGSIYLGLTPGGEVRHLFECY